MGGAVNGTFTSDPIYVGGMEALLFGLNITAIGTNVTLSVLATTKTPATLTCSQQAALRQVPVIPSFK